jgi:hypothetical protein
MDDLCNNLVCDQDFTSILQDYARQNQPEGCMDSRNFYYILGTSSNNTSVESAESGGSKNSMLADDVKTLERVMQSSLFRRKLKYISMILG